MRILSVSPRTFSSAPSSAAAGRAGRPWWRPIAGGGLAARPLGPTAPRGGETAGAAAGDGPPYSCRTTPAEPNHLKAGRARPLLVHSFPFPLLSRRRGQGRTEQSRTNSGSSLTASSAFPHRYPRLLLGRARGRGGGKEERLRGGSSCRAAAVSPTPQEPVSRSGGGERRGDVCGAGEGLVGITASTGGAVVASEGGGSVGGRKGHSGTAQGAGSGEGKGSSGARGGLAE